MRTLTRSLMILPVMLPLLASTLATSAASAADKTARKEATMGAGKPGGAFLTRNQLRACFGQKDKLEGDDAALLTEQDAVATQKADIARIGDELKARLDTIDRTSAEAVAAYNDAVQARDQQIDAYQARVTAFNTRVDANRAAHDSFKQGCSSRRYFEEDEIAIKKGK